ncbi:hypothetical protein F8M41_023078 [Gigaspora margarita]|uniref:Uncharacterized protein n=1 Tax=Gigaspora margarita TaxID=4874 RepID=A0A8H4AE17_GIGMA|nr:hypothetical protein F8M41_023078 [Gigaspora margarita]
MAVLEAFQSEEIYSQYIIQVAGKGYTVINHPSKVYKIPDTHKCIDGNQPLHLRPTFNYRPDPSDSKLPSLDSKKITCKDLISRILVTCTDALSLIPKYMSFLNSFALANSSNTDKCSWHIVYPYARFIDYRELKGYIEKGYRIEEKQTEEKFKSIDDENALNKGANLVFAKYGPKGLNFDKVLDKVKSIIKPKLELNKRIAKAVLNSHPLPELSGKVINIKEIEDALEVYPNFLSKEPSTTLICSSMITGKMKAVLDEVNTIQRQMNSGSNAQKSENTIRKTIEYLYDPNSEAEAMQIGFEFLKQGKHVAFVVTSSNIAQALVEKASKLSFKAHAYYGDMDRK